MTKNQLIKLCIGSIIVFFIYKIFSNIIHKEHVRKITSVLPNFKFFNLQNKPFTKDSIPANKKTVLLFFNTTCEHCQYETEKIIKSNKQLQSANFLFVSTQSQKELLQFDSIYHTTSFPFIRLLRDSSNIFYQAFGTTIVPSSFIYDSKGLLIKKFTGEVKIETIINLLK